MTTDHNPKTRGLRLLISKGKTDKRPSSEKADIEPPRISWRLVGLS
jgi:hypothetical protein